MKLDINTLDILHQYKFLRGSFKTKVEEEIATDNEYAYNYAKNVLHLASWAHIEAWSRRVLARR